jgi:hypothetical protein
MEYPSIATGARTEHDQLTLHITTPELVRTQNAISGHQVWQCIRLIRGVSVRSNMQQSRLKEGLMQSGGAQIRLYVASPESYPQPLDQLFSKREIADGVVLH